MLINSLVTLATIRFVAIIPATTSTIIELSEVVPKPVKELAISSD